MEKSEIQEIQTILQTIEKELRLRFHKDSEMAYNLMSYETKMWIDKIKRALTILQKYE